MKELLKNIMTDFHQSEMETVFERHCSVPINSGKVISLIGPRRCGKSYYFLQLIKQLIHQGVDQKKIIYLNFEDERLNFKATELDLVIQSYQELYPEFKLKDCYLFFDEIQNIEGWEKFARRCYDTISKNIFLTGSNANSLSHEIATAMRGRTLTFEILPLSFKEYLQFKNIITERTDSSGRSKIKKMFAKYLHEGGYPEVVLMNDSLKTPTLQEYFDVMIYRDLIERYQFSNLHVIKFFLKRIASLSCSYLSLNKIYNELRSQGYKLDKNLLYEIYEASKAVYLSMPIQKFDYSELKRLNSDKKTYFIDNGLLNAITFKFNQDYGKLLENFCHLEFRRQKNQVFYFKDQKECDFVLFTDDKKPLPIQVCYDLNDPDTYEREISGLLYACKKMNVKEGLILCLDVLPDQKINGVQIKYVDAMLWSLKGESLT